MTRNQKKLDEYSMVLYNNVLSLPLLLVAAGINGEYATILQVRGTPPPHPPSCGRRGKICSAKLAAAA